MDRLKFNAFDESFRLEAASSTSYLYFPLANEQGFMSCVTPMLGGDIKTGQDSFLLEPVSCEGLHNSKSTRNFWIYEEDFGIWSATGMSAIQHALAFQEDHESVTVEAGYMWHKVIRKSREFGMTSIITSYVPSNNDRLEVMIVRIKNTTLRRRRITATAAVPIYGRSADRIRDHRHVTSLLNQIYTVRNGVLLKPTLAFDEVGHNRETKVYGVLGTQMGGKETGGIAPDGFFPILESFVGDGGNLEMPRAIYDNRKPDSIAGNKIDGYETIGAIRFPEIYLKPKEEVTYVITMGIGDTLEEVEQVSMEYLTGRNSTKRLEDTITYWKKKLNISYVTSDSTFDSWMKWICFQPLLRKIYGCSFLPHHDYGRGGRGFRELWQDSLAFVLMEGKKTRNMLLEYMAGIRIDGTNATIIERKPNQFIADRNGMKRVWSDHAVWPIITLNLYIQQTGDYKVLLEQVPYYKDDLIWRGTKIDRRWSRSEGYCQRECTSDNYMGSVVEHLLIELVTAFYDVGKHNHIKLHDADWNDGLDMAGEEGESVAVTAMYAGNMEILATLLEELDQSGVKTISLMEELHILLDPPMNNRLHSMFDSYKKKRDILTCYNKVCAHQISGEKGEFYCDRIAQALTMMSTWIKKHIKEHEIVYDEEGYAWINGYYDNQGKQVEGQTNHLTRMMLFSQVATIMSGVSEYSMVLNQVKSVERYLYDAIVGGYRLNTNFGDVDLELGRMFAFAYGTKENGSVNSQMAVMYAYALYKRGLVREAYKVLHTLYKHCMDFEICRIYPGIPEYISHNGRGMYHYLTGAASWMMLTVTTMMFGVVGRQGDLTFTPRLVKEQFNNDSKAEVEFMFQSKKLKVIYYNCNCWDYGEYQVVQIMLNGEIYDYPVKNPMIRKEDLQKLKSSQSNVIEVILA